MQMVNLKRLTLVGQIARHLVRCQLALMAPASSQFPLPLRYWLTCRRILRLFVAEENPLFPTYKWLHSKGDSLNIPQLKMILASDLLGGWALDAQTIRLLWNLLWRDRPQTIVEYGSGVSTVLLAVYASLFYRQTGKVCRVISLETDKQHKGAVEQRLKENDLLGSSTILLLLRNDHGCYELSALRSELGCASIDFLLIDGPSGPPGCRYDTLPSILTHCKSGARWLLDDAFRDGELEILKAWSQIPNIRTEGIFPVGKGLAAGQVI